MIQLTRPLRLRTSNRTKIEKMQDSIDHEHHNQMKLWLFRLQISMTLEKQRETWFRQGCRRRHFFVVGSRSPTQFFYASSLFYKRVCPERLLIFHGILIFFATPTDALRSWSAVALYIKVQENKIWDFAIVGVCYMVEVGEGKVVLRLAGSCVLGLKMWESWWKIRICNPLVSVQ